MDRKSFLCCQSFLYPLHISAVPGAGAGAGAGAGVGDDSADLDLSLPLLNSDTCTTKCSSHEVLLADMGLSIEPCENAIAYNRNNNNNNNDNGKDIVNVNRTSITKSSSSGTRQSIGCGPAYFLSKKLMTTASTTINSAKHNANKADNNGGNGNDNGNGNDDGDKSSVIDPVTIKVIDPTFCKVELTLHTARLPEKGI